MKASVENPMNLPRLVVAGTHSSAGKTTVTLGLMAALKQRKFVVQGYKVGPDYIDPSYHTAVTGRASRNLDSWMLSRETVLDVFARAAKDADISIIEGVMGFFDGKDPLSNLGSTAEISLLLNCPVVLVIDAYGMARSAAAVVKGFQTLDPSVQIAGVIANRVGSEGHFHLIKQAVEQTCGIPVVGYLQKHLDIQMPERHLGLIPAIERQEHKHLLEELGTRLAQTVDLDAIVQLAQSAADLPYNFQQGEVPQGLESQRQGRPTAVIAVAKDEAFNFYYPENLELLEHFGAKLVFFSPLHGEKLPESADGLYIGGGFPEEFAAQLSAQKAVLQDLKQKIEGGLPTYAECGGYMFLAQTIANRQGTNHEMLGVIPATVRMQGRLTGFGYREVKAAADNWLIGPGDSARGHEFHYSEMTFLEPHTSPLQVEGAQRRVGSRREGCEKDNVEGYVKDNVVAGYTHLHFASNPKLAQRFVTACERYRTKAEKG